MIGSITFSDETKIQLRSGEDCVYVNDCQIRLLWTKPNFGGKRAWFKCPACRRRASVVYGREQQWACQRCWNGNYPSQKESRYDRLIRRARGLRYQLGDTRNLAPADHVDLAGYPPGKPRGMHWSTYRRITGQLELTEREIGELFIASATALLTRIKGKDWSLS